MSSPSDPPRISLLEKAAFAHVAVLLLASSWLFGGNIGWARTGLSLWASLSPALTIAAFLHQGSRGRDARRHAWWLLPLGLFSALVLSGTLNPSFRPIIVEGQPQLVHLGARHPDMPSTINPAQTLRAWWFGAGVYLSAFNLVIIPASRRLLRWLLVLISTNTLVLAVFGTVQKLSHAGFYFGAATSPNPRFFATFIYYNHWGAFMILCLATAAGLLFYHAERHRNRDLWHSPFTAALTGLLFIAVTAPVSASRAATAMAALVLAVFMIHAFTVVTVKRRAQRRPVWPVIALMLALAAGVTAAVGWLALRSINERYTETRIALDANQSLLAGRLDLYRDTWKLAEQKPAFGWGLASYEKAFQLVRPHSLRPRDWYVQYYANAHSDWLQSLAETGFVGTGLLLLMGVLPLAGIPRSALRHPLVAYPLLGCAIVLLYAWIEFPFGNGAVLIAFWTLYFSAIRLARLQSRHVPLGQTPCFPLSSSR